MAYADEAARVGRKPIRLVEVDLPKCALTYGVSPCTASGSSGDECYNTRKTCQDKTNYDGSATLTIKLSEVTVEHQFDMASIPCIDKIDTAHTRIEPARTKAKETTERSGGLGISCIDFPHHDRGIDPYVATRSYTPEAQGTFFGKLKARNPYYQDATVRIKTGYLADDTPVERIVTAGELREVSTSETRIINVDSYMAANFTTRTYYLEKFEGPDKKGLVKLIAQDASRKLDDKRVTCPIVTTGRLTAMLASGTTASCTVSGDEDLYETGGGRIAIGDEVIVYVSGLDNGDGTFTFTTLTRGQDGTTAAEHAADDAVQQCARFDTQTARQIAYTLLTTYGGIDSGLIDTTQWDTIADTWLQHTYSRTIPEPVGIRQLLGETFIQMAYFVWWDEEAGKFYLEAIRPPDYNTLDTYTQESHILRDSIEVLEDPERRITQVHIYYEPRTPFAKDKEDYAARARGIDNAAESDDEYGDSRILEVFANWVSSDGQAAALHGRMLNRLRDNLQIVKFRMDAKDVGLKTADQFYFNSDALQDEDGAAGTILMQVVQRDEIETGHIYEYRAYVAQYTGRYAVIAPAGMVDYGSATEAQKKYYGWIAGGADFSDGGTAYKII